MILAAPYRPAWLGAGLMLLLAACNSTPDVAAVPPVPRPALPQPEPQGPSQAELRKARAERNRALNATAASAQADVSRASDQRQAEYQEIEARLRAAGRLRRDRVPMDAPIDAERLARDFIQIALRDEYSRDGDQLVQNAHSAPLRRWQVPVRMQVEFGDTADTAARRLYRAEIASFATRLQGASGHPVETVQSKGNFLVLVLNEDERAAVMPMLLRLMPDLPARDAAALRDLDPRNFCSVFAYFRGDGAVYVRAVALIRAELPPLLRSSCIHEELAQGMGLANDSPDARPSIFNDDEEFALLTRHDELLLRMLYDPRLRPGMTEAEAAPIIRRIAEELVGTP
ncbi:MULTISPECIES: DUF2927 domain-containing protein [unclassified Paracoccus (in: a-proteobacteria)]|uniref:DUF2927 domain-containing protein n=1 Tax=unclassified Paracoccus (in: a-proteobacteria) TaxID=2688777 RepID=UPI001FFE1C08|nr:MULTISPECIES: DUF2927 domain-containing protein [unclassified Paracoccus (in: a-proteobacteria)]